MQSKFYENFFLKFESKLKNKLPVKSKYFQARYIFKYFNNLDIKKIKNWYLIDVHFISVSSPVIKTRF